MHETYCSIVLNSAGGVQIVDASADARMTTHPARESVLSYCGVPIHTHDGLPWGTLCHFDVRPRLMSQPESLILGAVAPLFTDWLGAQTA